MKKRIISLTLVVLLLILSAAVIPVNAAESKATQNTAILGDANLDGKVDITDVTWVQHYDAEMIELNDTALRAMLRR